MPSQSGLLRIAGVDAVSGYMRLANVSDPVSDPLRRVIPQAAGLTQYSYYAV